MLRGLRTASTGWLGKTVMAVVVGLLVIAFGIWGIGDIFRGGFTREAVATVGSSKISVEQFRQLYNNKLQMAARQLRRSIPPEQARALGFDRQVLGQWMQESALDQRARAMRLNMSQAEVLQRITEDPSFQSKSGQFDPLQFQMILRELGYTEQGFLAEQLRETLRRQITSTLTADIKPPRAAAEAINRYENEQRDAEFVVLTPAQAGDIPPPAPDVLAKYFEERKVLFRAPEYRKATVLALLPDEVAHTVEVSAADVKAFYEANADRFSKPEKRQVQQILFADKDEAHKAADRLKGGLSFDDLAKERNVSGKDFDLGLVTKSSIADRKVADVAFSLPAGQASDAIDGAFGATIVRVVKIEPGSGKPYAEIEPEVKKVLAVERAKQEIRKLRDKVDEEIGGGARLDEIAKKLNLPTRTIEAIDRSGRDPDGKTIDLPPGTNLIEGIFSADVGMENDPLQTEDGGLIWYDLVAVTPSRDRTLDEVKDKVEARWHDEQVVSRLNAKASEMVDKIKGGTSLAEVAAAEKLNVQHSGWLKRRTNSGDFPANAVGALFRTAKGAPASAEGKEPTERIVFVVSDVKEPAFDPAAADAKKISDALRNAMANDLYEQYLAKVEADLGISVDQAALDQAIGNKDQQ
ncbi:MAG TPA: SurA N-terminal domain-containing protein [Xanthobacteraceae bacterium]|nr:SurA N-terminal domain-containing protein [Xanthobacteraceae bacterium]